MVKYIERLGHNAPSHVILALNFKWFQNFPPSHYRFKNVTHHHSTIDKCDMKQESRFKALQSHDTVITLWTLDCGHLAVEIGVWTFGCRQWTMYIELRTFGCGHWTVKIGL